MKKGIFLSSWMLWSIIVSAQQMDLTGLWEGTADEYYYQINISQKGQSISGASFSRSPDSTAIARFLLTGVLDDGMVVLQEIEQTEPKNGGWCLKYMILRWRIEGDYEYLAGDWRADRCKPGSISLRRPRSTRAVMVAEEEPFSWLGRWSGNLSQSDRDYGFYYELNLEANGTGQSYIVSEDNGGSAYHNLTWKFNEKDSLFSIKESDVATKTDPQWKWCIKSATFQVGRDANRFYLEGKWQGFIEGLSPQTGACAPGIVSLEKPVQTQQIRQTEQIQTQAYNTDNQREVRVSRVIEVQKPTIRIKVWDSGTVDGDIVTLFLNGERILDKYRVHKSKFAIPVTLKADHNFLILHAEDLGSIPPNTIAVSVDDGVKEQIIVLSSDLKVSGAVLVKQFKVE